MTKLSFRLSDDFTAQYHDRAPKWGYTDAAGNSLGELTFIAKYSRIKEDGTKERWWEVCQRVVEGTFSIQKDHARENRLPWNGQKAQASAQEMYERMFAFKWTPPGRGLWVMGTPLVNEQRNSAALQNCFRGTEKLLTQEYGPVAFADIEGETVTVSTPDGWRKAEARSFGVQPVQQITFRMVGLTEGQQPDVHVATPNHRWPLASGVITDALSVGDSVLSAHSQYPREVLSIEPLPEPELVYCVSVPGEQFALASGILTMNCAFQSTADMTRQDPSHPFTFLMEASMLGVGVGFDDKGADKDFKIYAPLQDESEETTVIADTREGWVDSLRLILEAYLMPNKAAPRFDYSIIRPQGAIIRTFGGTAAGAGPLKLLHEQISNLFAGREGQKLTRTDIADIGNLIGVCVVSGNVRRSAELLMGRADDKDFLELKNFGKLNPDTWDYDPKGPSYYRKDWGWMSNNSVEAHVGQDLTHIIDSISHNGEPGVIWMDLTRSHGRLIDPPDNRDFRAAGFNPCLTGNTLVAVADGRGAVPIEVLANEGYTGAVYTVGSMGKIVVGNVSRVWKTRTNAEVHEVVLNDGSSVLATPDHLFMLEDGSYLPVSELEPDMALKSFASHVSEKSRHVAPTHFARKIVRVEYSGEADVYDLTVPGTNNFGIVTAAIDPRADDSSGVFVHNCAEQSLESGECCVSGSTLIHTRTGVTPITDLVGKEVDIWNGETWAPVEPFYAGRNELYRVQISDGSYLDVTPGHEWNVCQQPERTFKRLRTNALEPGMVLPKFELDGTSGKPEESAYEIACQMRRNDVLPSEIFEWDAQSVSSFMGGWVDTYGYAFQDLNSAHYELYGNEYKLRQAQILLRRIGVNHASLTCVKDDVFRLLVPTYEINLINTKLARAEWIGEHRTISEQKIVSITKISDDADTFCFNEPQRGMGVFGNVLTYQCTLVETYLNRHDSVEDFKRTLKFAYLYAKTVTLLPTHWPKTNAIMQRNRRIGTSVSGVANFTDHNGMAELRSWLDEGYAEVKRYDRIYSEWLCVRDSIKVTTVKPSGCRPADALTTTDRGILTLEELLAASGHRDGEEWQSFDGYRAPQGGYKSRSITKTYDNGRAEILSVRMAYGMEVQSTANHQWWSSSKGAWVRTDELQPNDILEVVPGVYRSRTEVHLQGLDPQTFSDSLGTVEIEQPHWMNPELGWLFGYFWGDGAVAPVDTNEKSMTKAQRILAEQFGLESTIRLSTQNGEARVLEVSSKMLWHWMCSNGVWRGDAGQPDLIPEVVRRSSTETILAFIAGLIDASARFNGSPAIGSVDGGLARHVQDVALTVGVVFGRVHDTLMCLGRETFQSSLNLMAQHSVSDPLGIKLSWGVGMLGAVADVESLGMMPSFDVEVADTHWYYAGGVKSHNTVSILAGESPGVHWAPGGEYYHRTQRFQKDNPLVQLCADAGYRIEPEVNDPDNTVVIYFPIHSQARRSEQDVSIFEKANLAVLAQRYWSDNSVSVTLSFDPETEAEQVGTVLHMHDGQLKTVSFLPMDSGSYVQMPYSSITGEEYDSSTVSHRSIDFTPLYDGVAVAEAEGEAYCTTDVCEMRPAKV